MPIRDRKPDSRASSWLAAAALAALSVAGCYGVTEFVAPTAPEVSAEWRALIDELRVFERRIGFRDTDNFASLSTDKRSFTVCGQASNRRLPYSYEDPAIRWLDSATEEECRNVDPDTDVYFDEVEAWGEIGTPVTAAMLESTLDRFVYLVIHEDCHDQFGLPYGIEEALCNIVTYRAMTKFAAEKFGWYALENRAIRRYAREQSRETRATIAHYAELEALYQRFERSEISLAALLKLRTRVFAKAERSLELPAGYLNTISLANFMTYSRHYPRLERVADSLGDDLGRVVEFFRRVDALKPTPEAVMQRYGISDQESVEFVRAYETAVIETITRIAPGFGTGS